MCLLQHCEQTVGVTAVSETDSTQLYRPRNDLMRSTWRRLGLIDTTLLDLGDLMVSFCWTVWCKLDIIEIHLMHIACVA